MTTMFCPLPAVGVPFGHPVTDTGVGGASMFTPCDIGLSLDGVHATIAPQTVALMTDHVLIAAGIPIGACRRLRNFHAEAEICPALWDAAHLVINDPAVPKPAT